MPSTISFLSEKVDLRLFGPVKWGKVIPSNSTGVYLVCMSEKPDKNICFQEAPIDNSLIQNWLNRVSTLELDGSRPTYIQLAKRISSFWLSDETILYIGKSSQPLKMRVNQYYSTLLGDSKPHAGGHWLKTLSNLNELNIFWLETNRPEIVDVEKKLLRLFMKNVSEQNRMMLFDSNLPLPFANLELDKGTRKKHGIKKSTLK